MVDLNQPSIQKYRMVSKRLPDLSLIRELRALFERRCSLDELLGWMHERVKFDKGDIVRHNDPKEILAYGRGRCGEFSILFTALCLAHDYRARLVLDMSDHVWTEVWDSGEKRWIHVDPSERRIDDPFMYERDWKKTLHEIYAFENGKVQDVTRNYKLMKV